MVSIATPVLLLWLACSAIPCFANEKSESKGIHVICWNLSGHCDDLKSTVEKMLDLDYVSGLLLYVDWRQFEPERGGYQWELFEIPLEAAEKRDKTISLALMVCARSPDWVMQKTETFAFRHIHPSVGDVTAPVPWNADYTDALYKTVAAVGARLDGHKGLRYVSINGPSTLFGVETNFPIASIAEHEANKVAFSLDKYERYWKESIDHFIDCFPKTPLALGLHDQISPKPRNSEQDVAVAKAIRNYAIEQERSKNGKRIVLRLLGLGSDNPKYFPGPYQGDPSILNDYLSLVWEVREHVAVAFEATRVFRNSNAGDRKPLSAEDFGRVLQNGISYSPDWIEI
ncbi:MAG TPA: beta-galactosidase, partial [bacterium]|nr:beta-galactosidase [bacterium]